jgi:hypothetical protein
MSSLRTILGVLAVSVAATACLDVPASLKPECTVQSDCDTTNGEVCEEGVCWGNPPEGTFAAVISPPSDQPDLVAKELTQLVISEPGWLSGLMLERPVSISGEIDAVCTPPTVCDRTITATVTITRDSHFAGGPGFKTVVSATGGIDGASFEANLPRTRDGDAEYIMTIVPDGRGEQPGTGITPAQLVPPMRTELGVPGNMTKVFMMGGLNLPVVDGTLVGAGSIGLGQHRVVALGRWKAGSPLTEVSTVAYTQADGKFRIVLSDNLEGDVQIVAKPWTLAAPTLRLGGVSSTGSSTVLLEQPAAIGRLTEITVPVRGKDGGGEIAPVRGARVRVSAQIGDAALIGSTVATFVAEGTTNDAGVVSLGVLDGTAFAASYSLEIVPPASSSVGVVFDAPLVLGNQSAIILPARVKVRGVVRDATGNPLKDVSVTARPSLRFAWSLADQPQAFLAAIPAATAITPSTGEFVVWVDPTITNLWGHYDLVFEPPTTSKYPARAPTWVQGEVAISSGDSLSLEDVTLPDAAFVHGAVTDPDGHPVEGAEVKVFRVNTTLALCSMVPNAPLSCPIPATLQGRGASDPLGLVRVTLPR